VPRILVGTDDGLLVFPSPGSTPSHELEGHAVHALTEYDGNAWAAVDRRAVWHSRGEGWSTLATLSDLSPTCLAWTDTLLVGTSEAHLLRQRDGELERVEAFDRAEGRDDWYTPWGGPPDARSITEWDADVYVNIHVGGILRTSDGGASWRPTIDIDADVHQVTVTDGLLLAACAAGLAQSADRGVTWSMRDDGLETRYARAVAICGDTVLMTASNGPRGGHAAVYRAELAQGPFARTTDPVDGNIDSHCLDALPDGSAAAYATPDGRLFWSADRGTTWEEAGAVAGAARFVLVLP
jgi:hypothetical protein